MNLIKRIKDWIEQKVKNPLFRNTLWMLLAKVSSVLMQGTSFIVVARTLGAENYGIFIGVSSLASIAVPFASLGAGDILIKSVSTNRRLFQEYWGKALFTVLNSSAILIIFLLVFSKLFLLKNISLSVLFLILVADILGLTLTFHISSKALIAFDLVKQAALVQVFLTISKFSAAIILSKFFQNSDILAWSWLYFVSTLTAAFSSVILVCKLLGVPKLSALQFTSEIRQGFYFAISESAATINGNIDKTMVAALSTLEAAGTYAAAYRVIDVGSVPIFSMLGATYAKFFEHGASGIRGSFSFAKRLLPIISLYGIIATIGFLILAPVVPVILGSEYETAVPALRWLAPVPFLIAVQFMAADTLTGAGFQKVRSIVQVTAALFNIVLNLWLIPIYSWKGAAWATLASEVLKLLCLWGAVAFFYRQQMSHSPEGKL